MDNHEALDEAYDNFLNNANSKQALVAWQLFVLRLRNANITFEEYLALIVKFA